MVATWTSPLSVYDQVAGAQPVRRTLALAVVAGAAVYNFILCFINTALFPISENMVVGTDVMLIVAALGLLWDTSSKLYVVLLMFTAYFAAVMALRVEFDPKVLRDFLIPIVFFFLGRQLGSERSADRLVTLLLFITLGSCLFEFLAPNFYLRFFDVIHYYIARGTVTDIDSDLAAGPYFNGTRVEGRALFPSLGDQRISGIFLEPPSVGNFATIAFAWILLRDRRNFLALTMKIVALSVIAVLADARFGLFFCLFTAVLYMITPLVRPTLLFVAPFLTMLALVAYAGAHWQDSPENTLPGRLLLSGDILSTLNVWQVFGLQATDFKSAASFAANGLGDAGYAYILVTAGLVGMAAIWALFAYTPPAAEDAARFRNFVAFYFTALLSISSAVFTIKTAALLWFLYGVLNRPGRGGGLPAKSASLF